MRINFRILLWPLAAAGLLGLAACGGDDDDKGVVVQQAPPRLEDQFGAGFGMAFRQDRTTADPVEPRPGDIITLTLTADPMEIT